MDQETAGGVPVHCRKRTVRRSQNRVSMRVEPASGCHSDDVLGQSLRVKSTMQEGSKSRRIVTKRVDTKVNFAHLPGQGIEQLM